ncbi:MAG: dihydrodipicolinate synthase family protein [Alphaproteobacteria bacterium]|nr:dihydrodipicolinate synthase family protein [Alphaproteobacteria bacterium]
MAENPRGVYAAILTPLTANFEPDLGAFVAHGQWLLANGCDGLAPLGTTGEANSLSLKQRMRIIEATLTKLPIERCIVGAGSCALADAVQLAREATRAGAGGVLMLPPFYYKNLSEDGLYNFFAAVVERIADPRLRLYLYHFPQLSAVPITPALIRRLRNAFGDTIAGLKDSGGDWNFSAALLKEFPGFGVFSGSEQYLLNNLRAGGVGTISASVNVTAPLAQPVYRHWQNTEADDLQATLTAVRVLFQDYPLVPALKETMALVTGNPVWHTLLPPNAPLGPAQAAALKAKLAALPAMQPVIAAARAA